MREGEAGVREKVRDRELPVSILTVVPACSYSKQPSVENEERETDRDWEGANRGKPYLVDADC